MEILNKEEYTVSKRYEFQTHGPTANQGYLLFQGNSFFCVENRIKNGNSHTWTAACISELLSFASHIAATASLTNLLKLTLRKSSISDSRCSSLICFSFLITAVLRLMLESKVLKNPVSAMNIILYHYLCNITIYQKNNLILLKGIWTLWVICFTIWNPNAKIDIPLYIINGNISTGYNFLNCLIESLPKKQVGGGS